MKEKHSFEEIIMFILWVGALILHSENEFTRKGNSKMPLAKFRDKWWATTTIEKHITGNI